MAHKSFDSDHASLLLSVCVNFIETEINGLKPELRDVAL